MSEHELDHDNDANSFIIIVPEEEHYCDDNLYILDYEHGARNYSRRMLVIGWL